MALARGAEDIGAPDEHVARPVGRIVGIVAGHFQRARLQSFGDKILGLLARRLGRPGDFKGVGLQLRGTGQPAHPFRADIIVDQCARPVARGRGR